MAGSSLNVMDECRMWDQESFHKEIQKIISHWAETGNGCITKLEVCVFFKFSVLHVTVGFALSEATGKRSSPHTVMLSTPGIKITERQKQTQTRRCLT